MKQRVLERQSHELHLGEKGKLKLIVTEPETAPAAEEESFKEKLVPAKVNKNCNPNQSFEIAVRVSNQSLIFCFLFFFSLWMPQATFKQKVKC